MSNSLPIHLHIPMRAFVDSNRLITTLSLTKAVINQQIAILVACQYLTHHAKDTFFRPCATLNI